MSGSTHHRHKVKWGPEIAPSVSFPETSMLISRQLSDFCLFTPPPPPPFFPTAKKTIRHTAFPSCTPCKVRVRWDTPPFLFSDGSYLRQLTCVSNKVHANSRSTVITPVNGVYPNSPIFRFQTLQYTTVTKKSTVASCTRKQATSDKSNRHFVPKLFNTSASKSILAS